MVAAVCVAQYTLAANPPDDLHYDDSAVVDSNVFDWAGYVLEMYNSFQ